MNDFTTRILKEASQGKHSIERQEPSYESKGMYHFAITDPSTGRMVVGLGSETAGDDFSWAEEIKPKDKDQYI